MSHQLTMISALLILWGCSHVNSPKDDPPPAKMKLLWEIPYDFVGSAINATPLLLGDSLVIMSAGKEIWCVEQDSGTIRWKAFVDDLTNIQTDEFATDGVRLFATHVEDVRTYYLADGTLAWVTSLPQQRGGFFDHTMCYSNGRVTVAGTDTVYSLDAATGSVLWKTGFEPRHLFYGVSTAEGSLFWGGSYSIRDSVSGSLTIYPRAGALNPTNGDTLWTSPLMGNGGVILAPLIAGNRLFAGTAFEAPSSFDCFDLSTGQRMWSLFTPNYFTHYEEAVIVNDRIITNYGLYGVQAIRISDGEPIWQKSVIVQNFEARKFHSYNGFVYHTQGWRLYVFNPDNGEIVHSMVGPNDQALVTIAIGNNRVFVQGHPSLMCFEAYAP